MANAKKGDTVRQIVTPIEGVVDSFQVDQESGELQCLVKWVNADGEEQTKYFAASEVEVV